MISRKALRQLFEGRTSEAMQHGTDMDGYRAGCVAFAREFHETMGVSLGEDLRASVLTNDRGLPYKAPASAHAKEVSLRALAESIMGHGFVEEYYHPSGGFDFSNRHLLEAAIDPSAFLNVNTFNISVSGLVNAEIMERFDAPEYIGRNMVEIKPTNMNGHKRIGVAKLGGQTKASKGRLPGEAHAEIGFGEMWQTTPETVEQGLKVAVTREAIFYDLTGQVTETAGEVGDELAYGQEKDIADTVLGVNGLASRYNFTGTSYETYQPTSPYANDLSNPFADVTSVDRARQLFVGMTDPVTGREIQVNSFDVLCFPFQELKIRNQLFGANIEIGSQNTAGNFPSYYTSSGNQLNTVGRGTYRLVPLTSIWRNRAVAADGLNLAGNVADLYWWIGDFARAFQWHENWPLTPWQANADELTMKDRGLVAVYGANYRGSMFTKEPRFVERNKN
jgi:hypothetical protein